MTITLRQDRIIDNWATLLDHGAGYGEKILDLMDAKLREIAPKEVGWSEEDVKTGLMSDIRQFLVFFHSGLREYRMFVGIRDFGQHLDCAWFLTVEPGLFKKAMSKYTAGNQNALSLNLDVFSRQDLEAFVGLVHHAFLAVIKEVMEELKQDITGMNTRSKGYLSVW